MPLHASTHWTTLTLGKTFGVIKGRLLGMAHRAPRRLRLRESLGLGEKRMVAVLEFDGRELLVGVTASSVSLLAECAPDHVSKTSAHVSCATELKENS